MKSKYGYNRKSYFAISGEVFELYRTRAISAIDVTVYAYLSSLRMNGLFNGVRVTLKTISQRCGISPKTVSASAERLYNAGLIVNVYHYVKPHCAKKYGTTTYELKSLPKTGFTLISRNIIGSTMPPKMFVLYLFFCHAQSFEFDKSWNSYNDIMRQLGYGECSRSEVIRLVKGLEEQGFINKRVRKIRKVFVDNIYHVVNFAKNITRKVWRFGKGAKKEVRQFGSKGTLQSEYRNSAKFHSISLYHKISEKSIPFSKLFQILCHAEEASHTRRILHHIGRELYTDKT